MENSKNIKKTYVFDVDGTICTNTYGKYEEAKPYHERINFVNKLYEEGHVIKMFTARGSTTNLDWEKITKEQFSKWGLKYHELKFKKPFGDIYIDDKAITDQLFFKETQDLHKNTLVEELNNKFKLVLDEFQLDLNMHERLELMAKKIHHSLLKGGKLIVCGNGGSMSDSFHIAAEFTGRFKKDRRPLPAIVLGSNPSSLTAISNDYSFEEIFSRELIALGKEEDILLLISTSGMSKNIIKCYETAAKKNINTFLFTSTNCKLDKLNPNMKLEVKSRDTAIIQQMHIYFCHIICEFIETYER